MEAAKLEQYRRRMLVIPVAAGILLFGLAFLYYIYENRRAENENYKDLAAVGKLKSTQIANWYGERSRDAAFYSTSVLLLNELKAYYRTGHLNRENLLELFGPTLKGGVYEEILITDINRNLLFSVNTSYSLSTGNMLQNNINAVIAQKKITVNLYYCPYHNSIHNDIMAPVVIDREIAGILVMRINPQEFIFPYIQEWPVSAKTAETILAARDGDSVVFLNEMKKVSNTALKYKLPLTDTIVPAVAAVSGKTGRFKGRDYIGDAVLSDLSHIKGTPWFLVVKIDKSEINEEVVYRTSMFAGIVILIIAFITGSLVLSYRRRQELYHRLNDKQIHERFAGELNLLVEQRTRELQKMHEDLLNFSHIVSHDLKEPVRKIKFLISLIKNSPSPQYKTDSRGYLNRIEVSADRLKELIEGIHNYTEVQDTNLELSETDMNDCINKILNDLELLIESKGASVTASSLPKIEGVSILLYKLFYNLIENALKFSRPGTTPEIKIEYNELEADGEKYAEICVTDNGIGFEEQYSNRIFEPFKRLHTKDRYEGAGLGLALCKKIAERHNGTIFATGESDIGATFHVILPFKHSSHGVSKLARTSQSSLFAD